MEKTRVQNRLAEIRKSHGVGASELARRVNVSRQTIYAIEAGTYVPNTEVALNLARELEVTVDELVLDARRDSRLRPSLLPTELLSVGGAGQGPAGASLRDRIALDERAGERVSVLLAGSRRHDRPR